MAAIPPQPFSNDEKNFLLAEIYKSFSPSHTVLLDVVNRLNVQIQWNELPLPPGRSLNACKAAFEDMRRGPVTYSPLSQAPGGSISLFAPMTSLSRPTEGQYVTGRKILPRQTPYPYSPVVSEPQPLKRKRGRPTKAEAQARAEAASSSSAIDPSTPHARLQTPMSVSVPPSPGIDVRPAANLPTVTRGLPISAMITTPVAPKSASHSSSSSGKRRRRRRSDEGLPGSQSEAQGRQALRYLSPTRQPAVIDPSARAASMMRRRDEAIHTSVARLGVSEPEQTAGARIPASHQSGSPSQLSPPRRPPIP